MKTAGLVEKSIILYFFKDIKTVKLSYHMAEQIKWEAKGDWICVLNFSSYSSEEFSSFKDDVLKLSQSNQKNLALDLTGVDYLNSVKIGFLVKVHKLLYPVKRKFAVYNCSDNLYNMAVSINLEEVIPFHSSFEDLTG